ncbi:MAG: glycosyltransferase family 39 protein [Bacteroidia bacterium]
MKHQNLIVLVILVLTGFFLQKSYINEFPSYIHAWAQSDRYALSQGFVNNDLNFFQPETFVYNHQFPDNWDSPSTKSISAVDFPIHDYIPAIFMKILDSKSPWIYRLYTLLYSFLGLFFLFKLSRLITSSFYKSILVTVFAATSPVFVYYQAGFLPTIPSLSNAIVGLYFYIKYIESRKNFDFSLSILFLTLGALSRTTFAIPLIAVLGLELLRISKRKAELKPKIFTVILSISSILAYLLYNDYLRKTYGSIFLNHLMPANNVAEFLAIIKVVGKNWVFQYFSITHYIGFILVTLLAVVFAVFKRNIIDKKTETILFLTSIIFFGCFLFSILMIKQYQAHDYYFIDTYFLPLLLLFALGLSALPKLKMKTNNVVYIIILLTFSIPLITNAHQTQKERRKTGNWDRTNSTINNFKDSENYLNSLGINDNAKILVIDAYAPNIPFLLMNRKGYVLLSTEREVIENALNWDYEYIVYQNEFFLSDIYSAYPEIISRMNRIGENGNISVCVLNKTRANTTLLEFLGLNESQALVNVTMDYETKTSNLWENTNSTSDYFYSGDKSGLLTPEMNYGLTYKTKYLPQLKNKKSILFFESYLMRNSINNVEIVVSITENESTTYYKSYDLKDLLKHTNEWEKISLQFELPKIYSDDYEFAIFICNTGKTSLFVDDFNFRIF